MNPDDQAELERVARAIQRAADDGNCLLVIGVDVLQNLVRMARGQRKSAQVIDITDHARFSLTGLNDEA